jgi:hypothetical protein
MVIWMSGYMDIFIVHENIYQRIDVYKQMIYIYIYIYILNEYTSYRYQHLEVASTCGYLDLSRYPSLDQSAQLDLTFVVLPPSVQQLRNRALFDLLSEYSSPPHRSSLKAYLSNEGVFFHKK